MLPKIGGYTTSFNETRCMSFLMKDAELLEKCNKTWDKFSNSIRKGFDSEPVYNEEYLKTKAKSYEGKISTNFHDDRIPKQGSHCICSSVTLTDSAFKIGKNYYPQVFLEKCKYIFKEKR